MSRCVPGMEQEGQVFFTHFVNVSFLRLGLSLKSSATELLYPVTSLGNLQNYLTTALDGSSEVMEPNCPPSIESLDVYRKPLEVGYRDMYANLFL